MTEAREIGRSYMKAAGTAVTTIADHNRKSMQLSGASALRSFEYLARLAGVSAVDALCMELGCGLRRRPIVTRSIS